VLSRGNQAPGASWFLAAQPCRNNRRQREHNEADWKQPALSCRTPAGVSKQLKTCMLTLADHSVARSDGIELKFRRLHGGARVVELHDDPGDAWSPKNPPHASPDSDSHPQPPENEELKS